MSAQSVTSCCTRPPGRAVKPHREVPACILPLTPDKVGAAHRRTVTTESDPSPQMASEKLRGGEGGTPTTNYLRLNSRVTQAVTNQRAPKVGGAWWDVATKVLKSRKLIAPVLTWLSHVYNYDGVNSEGEELKLVGLTELFKSRDPVWNHWSCRGWPQDKHWSPKWRLGFQIIFKVDLFQLHFSTRVALRDLQIKIILYLILCPQFMSLSETADLAPPILRKLFFLLGAHNDTSRFKSRKKCDKLSVQSCLQPQRLTQRHYCA